MQSVKLKFKLSHSLAELFSYALTRFGATGVVTVDKEELSALYKEHESTMYAVDEYLASLEEEAVIEAYFTLAENSTENPHLLCSTDLSIWDEELESQDEEEIHSLAELLKALEAFIANAQAELGGRYAYLGCEHIQDDDWAEAWKEFYSPMHLSPRITINPAWIAYEAERPEERIIEINPGSAFGTGYHESTEMCLRFIDNLALQEEEFFREARILDLGTGSGILAIAAAKLGAEYLDLVDIDEHAVEVARENFKKNEINIPEVQFISGELKDTEGQYDLIIANLIAKLHVDLAVEYAKKLRPEGYLILSGIIDFKCDEVKAALENASLELCEAHMKNDWWSLLYRRN